MPSGQVIDHVARCLAAVTRPYCSVITRKPFAGFLGSRQPAAQCTAKRHGSEAGMMAPMKIAPHCDCLHAHGKQPQYSP